MMVGWEFGVVCEMKVEERGGGRRGQKGTETATCSGRAKKIQNAPSAQAVRATRLSWKKRWVWLGGYRGGLSFRGAGLFSRLVAPWRREENERATNERTKLQRRAAANKPAATNQRNSDGLRMSAFVSFGPAYRPLSHSEPPFT